MEPQAISRPPPPPLSLLKDGSGPRNELSRVARNLRFVTTHRLNAHEFACVPEGVPGVIELGRLYHVWVWIGVHARLSQKEVSALCDLVTRFAALRDRVAAASKPALITCSAVTKEEAAAASALFEDLKRLREEIFALKEQIQDAHAEEDTDSGEQPGSSDPESGGGTGGAVPVWLQRIWDVYCSACTPPGSVVDSSLSLTPEAIVQKLEAAASEGKLKPAEIEELTSICWHYFGKTREDVVGGFADYCVKHRFALPAAMQQALGGQHA